MGLIHSWSLLLVFVELRIVKRYERERGKWRAASSSSIRLLPVSLRRRKKKTVS